MMRRVLSWGVVFLDAAVGINMCNWPSSMTPVLNSVLHAFIPGHMHAPHRACHLVPLGALH